ncbi:S-protein homolog 5-like [Papaver somniferum]|uniref:S-protein homolog 5-like n=1 Tax=Papaver somniferum TaxID=3469 RepID=UPI000E6F89F1|nr:S-protein homolog 5-like [Papaver somniferum]
MSKSSILVLGSATAIFLNTLLVLSLFQAQTVEGIKTIWSKKTVTLQNDIGPNITLIIHCRSSEDDLGEQILYYKQNFQWRFSVNVWETTKFVCESSWKDATKGDGHSNRGYEEKFTAYSPTRDWHQRCNEDCFWSIRRDGGYYGDGKTEGESKFPFLKMFSYE